MTDVVARYTLRFKDLASKGILKTTSAARLMAKSMKIASVGFAGSAGAAGAAAVALANKVATRGDEFSKLARQTDISAQSLQRIAFIAERQGTTMSKVKGTIQTFTKRMGELRAGTGPLLAGLKKINPALIDQFKATKSNEEAYDLLLDVVSKLPDAQAKAALGAAAASKEGAAAIIRLTDGGAEALAKLRVEANKYRPPLSEKELALAESYQDSYANLAQVVGSLADRIGVSLMPRLKSVFDTVSNWVAANRELVNSKIENTIQSISDALKAIDFQSIATKAAALIPKVESIAQSARNMGSAFQTGLDAVKAVGNAIISLQKNSEEFGFAIGKAIRGTFIGIANFVIDIINKIKNSINTLADTRLGQLAGFEKTALLDRFNPDAPAAARTGTDRGKITVEITGNVKGANVQANAVGTGIVDTAGSTLPTSNNAQFVVP
jgi:uncharacterized protein YoxC